jgi:hypothetical protein
LTSNTANPASAAARTGSGYAVCLSSSSAADAQANSPPHPNRQGKFQDGPASITCASMRMDELRGCLIREISRTIAIGLQAQAALLDGDDDLALANLRRHWRALRASIAPLAAELQDLAGERP